MTEKLPTPVLILDRSGSMGEWSSKLGNEFFGKALLNIGYSEDAECIVITFDSNTERVKYMDKDPKIKI
eukprot:UN33316